jgi:23S rRNA (adenine2503-C2)-methyltransferase
VLEKLPFLYNAPGLIPCIPTIAPLSASQWFEKLLDIKRRLYQNGHFQLQFSINSTDEKVRDIIMPVRKWNFEKISEFGQRWFESGDRKVVLNFALAHDIPVDPGVIKEYFSPDCFMVKLTPVNPTWNAKKNGYNTVICSSNPDGASHLVRALQHFGFDCVVSIGDEREIEIGSNCGQAASLVMERENSVKFEGVANGN